MAELESSPVLLPDVTVRASYAAERLVFRVLRPPFPTLGLGTLRVLRVRDRGNATEITAGYDGYERLPAHPEAAR